MGGDSTSKMEHQVTDTFRPPHPVPTIDPPEHPAETSDGCAPDAVRIRPRSARQPLPSHILHHLHEAIELG